MVNEELIKESYEILRVSADISKTYYQQKLVVLYSGGKDSDVLLQLARECLSPDDFRVVNSHVTVDAPQTVYYIRDKFKELASEGIETETIFHRDKDGKPITMWSLILDKKTPPTRFKRYCCKELKEVSAPNSFSCTGVRGDESSKRRGRDSFTVWNSKSSKAPYFSLEHTKEVFENAKMERERAVRY